MDDQPRGAWQHVVHIARTRCLECDSASLLTTKSISQGDGSTARITRCRECGFKFVIVVE